MSGIPEGRVSRTQRTPEWDEDLLLYGDVYEIQPSADLARAWDEGHRYCGCDRPGGTVHVNPYRK